MAMWLTFGGFAVAVLVLFMALRLNILSASRGINLRVLAWHYGNVLRSLTEPTKEAARRQLVEKYRINGIKLLLSQLGDQYTEQGSGERKTCDQEKLTSRMALFSMLRDLKEPELTMLAEHLAYAEAGGRIEVEEAREFLKKESARLGEAPHEIDRHSGRFSDFIIGA